MSDIWKSAFDVPITYALRNAWTSEGDSSAAERLLSIIIEIVIIILKVWSTKSI